MQNKTSLWVGGAVLVVVAILAAAYFLLIGPVMESTAQTDEQRSQVETQNQVMRSQNATLRTQFENIGELRDQLAVLQQQVPDAVEWDRFTTMVGDIANANGAVVMSIAGQPVTAISGTAPAGGEEAPEGAAATAAGLALPVMLAFQGQRDAVIGTIRDLQKADQRLFLVETLEIRGLEPSDSAQPPVAVNDVGVVISGYVFVQPPVTSVPDQAPPPALNDNQFVPSG